MALYPVKTNELAALHFINIDSHMTISYTISTIYVSMYLYMYVCMYVCMYVLSLIHISEPTRQS